MQKTRVLLADDHAVVRAGIKNAIEEINFLEVIGEAVDGPTVHSALEIHKPDLLLIDVTMPEFDPIPAIKKYKKTYPGMKILVISAYDDDVYVQGLLQAGVNGYHLKDQSLKDLRLALQRVMEGEKWISSPLVDKLISYQESDHPQSPLTMRQREILRLLRKGHSNQSIALELNLSIKTIENHLTRIYRIIDVKSRVEAVNFITNNPEYLGAQAPSLQYTADQSLSRTDGINLLLVDDNSQYRQQLKRIILNIHPQASIHEADSIQQAVEIATSANPKLVLIDVLLGDESGIQCAKKIHMIAPDSRVILISAYPDTEFRRESLDAGAAAFIDKKVLDSSTLRQIIDDNIA